MCVRSCTRRDVPLEGWLARALHSGSVSAGSSRPEENANISQTQTAVANDASDYFLRWARKDIAQRHAGMVALPSAVEEAIDIAVKGAAAMNCTMSGSLSLGADSVGMLR